MDIKNTRRYRIHDSETIVFVDSPTDTCAFLVASPTEKSLSIRTFGLSDETPREVQRYRLPDSAALPEYTQVVGRDRDYLVVLEEVTWRLDEYDSPIPQSTTRAHLCLEGGNCAVPLPEIDFETQRVDDVRVFARPTDLSNHPDQTADRVVWWLTTFKCHYGIARNGQILVRRNVSPAESYCIGWLDSRHLAYLTPTSHPIFQGSPDQDFAIYEVPASIFSPPFRTVFVTEEGLFGGSRQDRVSIWRWNADTRDITLVREVVLYFGNIQPIASDVALVTWFYFHDGEDVYKLLDLRSGSLLEDQSIDGEWLVYYGASFVRNSRFCANTFWRVEIVEGGETSILIREDRRPSLNRLAAQKLAQALGVSVKDDSFRSDYGSHLGIWCLNKTSF
jgi:hypothetical protein